MWTHSARLPSVISLKKKKNTLLKTNFKQIKEKVIEGVLMLSSAATSITVILIVFSIYRRCWGFTRKPIDKGFYLVNGSMVK
jgi:phosphate transport system permease protein